MATTTPAPSADAAASRPPSPTLAEPDWPAQAADAIVEQVGKIRDKTTGPALKVARYVIFAAFGVLLGTVAALIFVIGAVRALDVLADEVLGGTTNTWAAHGLLGLLFVLGSAVAGRKMRSASR